LGLEQGIDEILVDDVEHPEVALLVIKTLSYLAGDRRLLPGAPPIFCVRLFMYLQ